MNNSQPIGIFDSGLGGLSVAREIRQRLPHENLLYMADSAYCPYGGRPLEEIRERSLAVTGSLVEQGVKIVVVACNTASGAAVESLRATFSLPIVALEPAVKPAALSSVRGKIAVMATPATLKTERFSRLLNNHGSEVEVVKIPCPGFVELVESGVLDGEQAEATVRQVTGDSMEGVDQLVLGCTHYPFLRDVISRVVGDGVQILDSGAAVARQVERVLRQNDLLNPSGEGSFAFQTTGDVDEVGPVVDRLWGDGVRPQHVDA